MTTFDWGQLITDGIIGLMIGLHSHPINWRRR